MLGWKNRLSWSCSILLRMTALVCISTTSLEADEVILTSILSSCDGSVGEDGGLRGILLEIVRAGEVGGVRYSSDTLEEAELLIESFLGCETTR